MSPEEIARVLTSEDLQEVERGLFALADHVEAAGRNVDLSFLELDRFDNSRRSPIFAAIGERFADQLSTDAALALIRGLVNKNASYHGCRDANPFIEKVAENPSREDEQALIEIYKNASTYCSDGHLDEDGRPRDLFVEVVFPKLSGEALLGLLQWASEANYMRDLAPLFVAAFAKELRQEDERALFSLLQSRFEHVLETGQVLDEHTPDAWVLQECANLEGIPEPRATRLQQLNARVDEVGQANEAISRIIVSGSATEVTALLENLGQSASPACLLSTPSNLAASLARHHGDIPVGALTHAFDMCLHHHHAKDPSHGAHWVTRFSTGVRLLRVMFSLDADAAAAHCAELVDNHPNDRILLHDIYAAAAHEGVVPKWLQDKRQKDLYYSFVEPLEALCVAVLPKPEQLCLDAVLETLAGFRKRLSIVLFRATERTMSAWRARWDLGMRALRFCQGRLPEDTPDLDSRLVPDLPTDDDAFRRLVLHVGRSTRFRALKLAKTVHFGLQESGSMRVRASVHTKYRH